MLAITGRYTINRFAIMVSENLALLDMNKSYDAVLKVLSPQNPKCNIDITLKAEKASDVIIQFKRQLNKVKNKEAIVFGNLNISPSEADD